LYNVQINYNRGQNCWENFQITKKKKKTEEIYLRHQKSSSLPPKTMLQYACVQHHPNTNNIGQGERVDAISVAEVFMIGPKSPLKNVSKIHNPFWPRMQLVPVGKKILQK